MAGRIIKICMNCQNKVDENKETKTCGECLKYKKKIYFYKTIVVESD